MNEDSAEKAKSTFKSLLNSKSTLERDNVFYLN